MASPSEQSIPDAQRTASMAEEPANERGQDDSAPPPDPAALLRDRLTATHLSQADLARRTGLSVKHVNQLAQGLVPFTTETALMLEKVLGVSAGVWSWLEAQRQEQIHRQRESDHLSTQAGWLRQFPLPHLRSLGLISKSPNPSVTVSDLLTFFGVASIEAWEAVWLEPQYSFRKAAAYKSKPGPLAVWLRMGEKCATSTEIAVFDREAFRAELPAFRALTRRPPEVWQPRLEKRCAELGVLVSFVPEVPGARVSGATRWLSPAHPIIQLSLRYKTNDQMWFSFFHEAGHVILHGKRDLFVDEGQAGDAEDEANRFAADLLIPPRAFREVQNLRTRHEVEQFAEDIGVAPGIVVGRMQRERILPFSHLNDLKERFTFKELKAER